MSKILTPEDVAMIRGRIERAGGNPVRTSFSLCDSHEALRAELYQAQAQIAILRKHLLGYVTISDGKGLWVDRPQEVAMRFREALAATPADCLKNIEARVLRDAAARLDEIRRGYAGLKTDAHLEGLWYAIGELERMVEERKP